MPLLHPARDAEPLKQGDVLKDVQLYSATADGSPAGLASPYCLVLSRNCNAFRDKFILVVAIEPAAAESFEKITRNDAGGLDKLDTVRRRYDALRDGDRRPDTFYVGEIPSATIPDQRFAAKLDSIHTIEVPAPKVARATWIGTHRVARLSDDHRRHLHGRVFDAIAHEGFDDYKWWSDLDLKAMLAVGKNQLAQFDIKISELEAHLATLPAKSAPQPRKGIQDNLDKVAAERLAFAGELQPFLDEAERRMPKIATPDDAA